MAVFPVPGCPAIKTARPAIFPSWREKIILRFITEAQLIKITSFLLPHLDHL